MSEPFENLMAKLIPLSHQYMTADLPGWVLQIKHFLVLISAMRLGTGIATPSPWIGIGTSIKSCGLS